MSTYRLQIRFLLNFSNEIAKVEVVFDRKLPRDIPLSTESVLSISHGRERVCFNLETHNQLDALIARMFYI